MSTQVERLQALLERVEHNRQKPRAPSAIAHANAVTMPEMPVVAPLMTVPSREAPVSRGTAPGIPAQAAPAPARPAASLPQRQVVAQEIVAPARVPRAAEPAAAKAAAAPNQPSLLVDTVIEPPSKSIAQVVSKHPPSTPLSFGDLLRRSLSARPR